MNKLEGEVFTFVALTSVAENPFNETIIATTILLGFFISILCPILWVFYLKATKKGRQSLLISKGDKKKASSWPFQGFKYGPGGTHFFPGSAFLAESLLIYNPIFSTSCSLTQNLSDIIKEFLLRDIRKKEEDERLKKALEYDSEDESDEDLDTDELLFNLNSETEKRRVKDREGLRLIMEPLKSIQSFISQWSAEDLCLSLIFRLIIRDVYPTFSEMLDEKGAALLEGELLCNEAFSSSLLEISQTEEGLKAASLSETKPVTRRVWYCIFNFIILNYRATLANNSPNYGTETSKETRSFMFQFLKENHLLSKGKKEKNTLVDALIACVKTGFIADYLEAGKKDLKEDFQKTFWEAEVLFHSMSLFNVFRKKGLIVREDVKKKGFHLEKQEFEFYKDGLLFSLELCGYPKEGNVEIVESTLESKEKDVLFFYLTASLAKKYEEWLNEYFKNEEK